MNDFPRANRMQAIGEMRKERPEPEPCKRCGILVQPQGTGQFWLVPSHCPDCLEAMEQEEKERKMAFVAEDQERRWREFMATIPPRSRDAVLDALVVDQNNRKAIEAIRQFCAEPRPGFIFLSGPAGTGKTFLATAALKSLWKTANESALYLPYLDLISALRRDVGAGNDENMTRYRDAEVILIDDLDEPRENHWSETRGLVTLLSSRYDWGRITIVTSNLGLGAFGKAHGPRMADRVQEAGLVFELAGGSRRRGK